jgi:hypothetical protein
MATDQLILSSLPLPLARIFRDFDDAIRDGLPKEDNKKKGSSILGLKKKKKIGALEGWVGELAMVYNMDQDIWSRGFNWGEIFYQRLVCTQQLLQEKFYQLYLDVFSQYTENNLTIKKDKRPRQSAVVCSLVPWLQMHRMDHDNALVGLKPNEEIRTVFQNWWASGKNDLSAMAHELDVQVSSQAATANQEVDPYLLYSAGYPARFVTEPYPSTQPLTTPHHTTPHHTTRHDSHSLASLLIVVALFGGVLWTIEKEIWLWLNSISTTQKSVRF